MATKGSHCIERAHPVKNNIIDVTCHCKVVCKSDAQDRDVLDSFKTFYSGWW